MRPVTSPVLARALAAERVWHHTVEIRPAGGAWTAVTTYLKSFTWTEDRDAGSAAGTLTLRRDASVEGVWTSLSPLVGASPLNAAGPLLNPFGGIRVLSAVTAPGETPAGADFLEVFRGIIDDPSWGGRTSSTLTVGVRDLAGPLQDAIVRQDRTYGSTAGVPVLTVLQQILSDNGFGGTDYTVTVVGDTEGWSLRKFTQARGVSVWDAVRTIALEMGWDFRFWWHADGTYRPTLLKPTRDTDVPDLTFTASQFTDLPKLRLNGTDVRNWGELRYRDRDTGKIESVYATDPGSIVAFNLRAFGLNEDATSNVDTASEAQQFIDAAVADLSTPYVEQDAVHPYLPWLQLGDVLAYPATTLADGPQAYGLTAVRHDLTATGARTTPSLRGRPVGAYQRWLALIRAAAIADDAASTPKPLVGPLLGEASVENGDAVDGAVWMPFTFDKHSDALEVFVNWAESAPVPTVPIDDAHRAYVIRRMEGKTGSAEDWSSIAFLATNRDYYKRALVRPIGYEQQTGEGVSLVGRAIDGFEATMGLVPTVTVTRDGADNVITWEAEASESPYALWLIVWRNGFPLTLIPWAAEGEWTDEDVPVNQTYEYQLQAFTHDGARFARSGPLKARIQPGTGAPIGEPIEAPGTPPTGPETQAQVPYFTVSAVATATGGDAIRIEAMAASHEPTTIRLQRSADTAGPAWEEYAGGGLASDGVYVATTIDEDVVAGTTYYYRVQAQVAGKDHSEFSDPKSATAAGAPAAPVVGATGVLTEASESTIEVTYDVEPGVDTIYLYRASATGTFSRVYNGPPSSPYVDTGTLPGRTSRFYAVALLNGRASADSNIASATAPFPP